jgi:hypothetical protein
MTGSPRPLHLRRILDLWVRLPSLPERPEVALGLDHLLSGFEGSDEPSGGRILQVRVRERPEGWQVGFRETHPGAGRAHGHLEELGSPVRAEGDRRETPRAEGDGREEDAEVVWSASFTPLRASELEHRIVSEALERTTGRLFIHGAGIVVGGGTWVVSGPSGSGKTTLAMGLWSRGLSILGDDVCPIDAVSLRPEALPRALHTDGTYPPELLNTLPAPPLEMPEGHRPFPGPAPIEAPLLAGLIVPVIDGPEEGAIETLSQAEVVHHLVRQLIRTEGFDFSRAVRTMAQVGRTMTGARVRASTIDGMLSRVLQVMGRT